jgi:hypothetical protein
MQIIQSRLTGNILTNDGYNDVLESIDNTIANIATVQYKNHIFGFQSYVDYNLYDRLCEYREILMDKLMGCNCLDDEYTIYIISKIQTLTC